MESTPIKIQPVLNQPLSMKPGARIRYERFKLAKESRNLWRVMPDGGTSYEDLFNKEYWGFVASQLRMFDLIEVVPEDSSYYAELIVVACGRSEATVHELRKHVLPEIDTASMGSGYEAKWGGPYDLWRIIRASDNSVIKKHFATKDEAMAVITKDYSRSAG